MYAVAQKNNKCPPEPNNGDTHSYVKTFARIGTCGSSSKLYVELVLLSRLTFRMLGKFIWFFEFADLFQNMF